MVVSKQVNRFLPDSRSLYSQVQTIAGELAEAPISQKKYQSLTKKLDAASRKLQVLEEKALGLFIQKQTEHLKERVVALSGELVDRFVEKEVSQIQEESCDLRQKVSQSAIKNGIKKLQSHIDALEKEYRPSLPHRRIIADAKHALLEAKAQLEGKPKISHFTYLASQKTGEMDFLLPGEVEELLDIAKVIYDGKMTQAKSLFNQLPEDHKQQIKTHLRQLAAKPFEDRLETMQALIATVNELVGNGEPYPTKNEIDELFLGLSQLGEETKVHSFRASFASDMM